MSVQTRPTDLLSGEYLVVSHGDGGGLDHYLEVTGPDGRVSRQMVLWTYSKTAHQVVEEAVAAHVGEDAVVWRSAPTREAHGGGHIVTLRSAEEH